MIEPAGSEAATVRITGVQARCVLVPLETPHVTAAGVISESPLVLTDVHTDSGTVGHSIVFTYTRAALKPTAELVRNLGPLLTGHGLAPTAIEEMLTTRFRLLGTQGLVGMAIAAIDMALWDALARHHGVALMHLLGAAARPLRAYGAVGYEGAAGSARTAESWARQGFAGVKAKIGYPGVHEDVAVVRAIRSAVGPSMAIMVDYNQCLTPVEAVQRARHLDGEGLTWIEEPTLAHDHAGHAAVARAASTPIQCGENWWGILDLQHALDAGASDCVMPEVMKIGGVTGWMRAAALAHAKNIPVSSHLWPEVSAQLMCCAPGAHWLEYATWWNPILADPLRIENGTPVLDGVRGSGVQWNEPAVERFAA